MGQGRKVGNRNKRSKKKASKYAGKAVNDELRTVLGGVAGKLDSQLFFEEKNTEEDDTLSKKDRLKKRRMEKKLLRSGKKSVVEERLVDEMVTKEEKRTKKRRTDSKKVEQEDEKFKDLWGMEPSKPPNEWIPENNHGKSKRNARKVHSKPSTYHKVDAVRVVHPGASYNPTLTDMQEALSKTIEKEKVHQKRKNVVLPFAEPTYRDYHSENDVSSESEEEEEVEKKPRAVDKGTRRYPKPEPGERVTRTQRNKEARRKQRLREQAMLKSEQRREEAIGRLDEIEEELETRKRTIEDNIKERKKLKLAKLEEEPLPKVCGRPVFLPPPVEAILPSDVSATMREMKPHGGFLLDRFTSMQARNKFEAGSVAKRIGKKKQKNVKKVPTGKPFFPEEDGPKPKRGKNAPKGKEPKRQRNHHLRNGAVALVY